MYGDFCVLIGPVPSSCLLIPVVLVVHLRRHLTALTAWLKHGRSNILVHQQAITNPFSLLFKSSFECNWYFVRRLITKETSSTSPACMYRYEGTLFDRALFVVRCERARFARNSAHMSDDPQRLGIRKQYHSLQGSISTSTPNIPFIARINR